MSKTPGVIDTKVKWGQHLSRLPKVRIARITVERTVGKRTKKYHSPWALASLGQLQEDGTAGITVHMRVEGMLPTDKLSLTTREVFEKDLGLYGVRTNQDQEILWKL